jgi:hypothetical protein
MIRKMLAMAGIYQQGNQKGCCRKLHGWQLLAMLVNNEVQVHQPQEIRPFDGWLVIGCE